MHGYVTAELPYSTACPSQVLTWPWAAFVPVRIYKLHLESPLRLCVVLGSVVSCHVMSSLLLRLPVPARWEQTCLQFLWLLAAFSQPLKSWLAYHWFNEPCTQWEIQQETQLNCISDRKQLLGEVYKHAKYYMGHTSTITYSLFSRSSVSLNVLYFYNWIWQNRPIQEMCDSLVSSGNWKLRLQL